MMTMASWLLIIYYSFSAKGNTVNFLDDSDEADLSLGMCTADENHKKVY